VRKGVQRGVFTITGAIKVNDGQEPTLSTEHVWNGLQLLARAADPLLIPPGHQFEVIEDNGNELIRSVRLADGTKELQRITFHGNRVAIFDFIEGPQLGHIIWTIETDLDGEDLLRMTTIAGFEWMPHQSASEIELAETRRPLMPVVLVQILGAFRKLAREGVL
jgi:hypothetical protein